MVDVDWSDPVEEGKQPGIYLAEVKSVDSATSRKGDAMLVVEFLAVGFSGSEKDLCRDWIMLAGKGRGMGQKKLVGLGVERGATDWALTDLIGRRAWVEVEWRGWENQQGEKQKALGVAPTTDNGCQMGYWPEEGGLPDEVSAYLIDPPQVSDENVPF